MKTITIQIGNTDNKLTQQDWACYVNEIKETLIMYYANVHFFGGSSTWDRWQNVAWVFEYFAEMDMEPFTKDIICIRKKYKQDSIAITVGETEFI